MYLLFNIPIKRGRNDNYILGNLPGYYSRYWVLHQLLLDFLDITHSGESELPPQILSLGAGYDTTWFGLQVQQPY